MKQMSDVETTTSSRPALYGVLMFVLSSGAVVVTNCFYHRYAEASTAVSVTDFYDRHPISEAQVLDAVRRHRGHAHGALTADDLFPFDQDHYGGLAAVDTLARL